jgi:aryl-alcohol dehydrogenase-like predicted oxidoreductase
VPNVFQQRVTPATVEAAVKRSLAALRVDKLDLVQMHWCAA